MGFAYGVICLVSLILIGVCLAVDRKRDIWLFLLFVSIFVCNLGYFLLSISKTLGFALMANRISYLGSVFLPLFMLMMILNLCSIKCKKWLPASLIAVGTIIFAIAASPGISQIYYKSVALDTTGGITKLMREYGPLHCLYYWYLFVYFASMIAIVAYAIIKKKIRGTMQAVFMLSAVLGNIVIWLIERFVPRNFEFLSVSYVFTEVLILLLYGIIQEYSLLDRTAGLQTVGASRSTEQTVPVSTAPENTELFTPEQIEYMMENLGELSSLTAREKDVLRLMLGNRKRKDIADELCITESTIKKYTSQIYKKLSVSSRIELFARLRNQI